MSFVCFLEEMRTTFENSYDKKDIRKCPIRTYYASPALCYEINFTWTFLCQQKRNIESKVWSQFQPILDLLNTEAKNYPLLQT